MKTEFSVKQINLPRKTMELVERGKGLLVPRVWYTAEKFPDSKEHSRE